jgi:hypothetical protein
VEGAAADSAALSDDAGADGAADAGRITTAGVVGALAAGAAVRST